MRKRRHRPALRRAAQSRSDRLWRLRLRRWPRLKRLIDRLAALLALLHLRWRVFARSRGERALGVHLPPRRALTLLVLVLAALAALATLAGLATLLRSALATLTLLVLHCLASFIVSATAEQGMLGRGRASIGGLPSDRHR